MAVCCIMPNIIIILFLHVMQLLFKLDNYNNIINYNIEFE